MLGGATGPRFAAFVAGAGVMAVEMLASRWLAPAFGTSLTTWSLLIATALLAGSAGAFAGGRLGERHTRARLAACFAAAGLWLLVCGLAAPRLVDALLPLPPIAGAAVGSLLLVAPTVGLLAAVLPLAASLRAPAGASGREVGGLVAASTLGSLVGTLAVALWTIPAFGLALSAYVVAGVAFGVAALAARARPPRVAAAAGALLALLAALVGSGTHDSRGFVREGAHGRVEIVRTASGGGALLVDGVLQGAHSSLAAGRGALLRRRQYVELLPHLHPRGVRALNVGLGTGVVARVLGAYGIAVESVEVNPALLDLVRRHLGFDGRVRLGDGRAVWRRLSESYDFVVLDAFQGEVLPSHLVTREAFAELRERLAPGGILCVHLIGQPAHPVTAAIAATLETVFEHRLCLRSGVAGELQDLFLLASDAPLSVPPSPQLAAWGWMGDEAFVPARGGLVLTDDRNPLPTLNEPLARALRQRNRRTGV